MPVMLCHTKLECRLPHLAFFRQARHFVVSSGSITQVSIKVFIDKALFFCYYINRIIRIKEITR